jgi:16S rRNA (uracil1498-N3)-methyltransferase
MSTPFFYVQTYSGESKLELDEDTSRHLVQVLRMKEGEEINLTDGKGNLLTCVISDANKKHCLVEVKGTRYKAQGTHLRNNFGGQARKVSVAISLLKNRNRFEWFLEKATEIGVREIIPLICERTEKEKFRYDRMNAICISAMLQSQQCWLPVLHEPVRFEDLVIWKFEDAQKLIAHCVEEDKQLLNHHLISKSSNHLIAIGPEGDFTPREIEQAIQLGFVPVSLGETRLRTETAGVVAAGFLCLG